MWRMTCRAWGMGKWKKREMQGLLKLCKREMMVVWTKEAPAKMLSALDVEPRGI